MEKDCTPLEAVVTSQVPGQIVRLWAGQPEKILIQDSCLVTASLQILSAEQAAQNCLDLPIVGPGQKSMGIVIAGAHFKESYIGDRPAVLEC